MAGGDQTFIMNKETILDITVPVLVFGVYVPLIILTTCVLSVFHFGTKALAHP